MHRLVLGLKGSWQVSGLAPMNTLSKRKVVHILWFLSNSPHPWIFTLGVKAGLKDSISRQKASSISSSLSTEIKCVFIGKVLLSSNLIVYTEYLRRLVLNLLSGAQMLNSRASSGVCVLSDGTDEMFLPNASINNSETLHRLMYLSYHLRCDIVFSEPKRKACLAVSKGQKVSSSNLA